MTAASNFAFLRAEWPDLFDEAQRVEQHTFADPRYACFYARRCLEHLVKWLYRADEALRRPYRGQLAARIAEPALKNLVGEDLHAKMEIIRRQGNQAVHESRRVSDRDALVVCQELFHLMYWLARTYTRDQAAVPSSSFVFDEALLPRPQVRQAKTRAELRALADQLAAQEEREEREAAAELDGDLDEQVKELRRQVAAAKARNSRVPDTHDYNEQQTRDLFIDLLLHEAGWALDQARDIEFQVSGMPNQTGIGYVDYVLWGDDDRPLAIVEAKSARRHAIDGQNQAQLYADALERMYGRRPVIFYTNGYEIWLWDDVRYPYRKVQGFYTKDQLDLLIQRRSSRQRLADTSIDWGIVNRHYQQRAIRRIADTFEVDGQRKALVVMATGAGKTRTTIALVDLLQRANWIKRVLFLADRLALVQQATNAFKTHLPDTVTVNLSQDRNRTDGRVYVATYPTMMGLINELDEGGSRRFGPGYFDLVIIDEAHRSVYQKYGAIFDYFDSLLVGLTATPKDEVDRNTYRLFNLENGVPTDAYGLQDAIREGYLVPPRAVSVAVRYPRHGIRYDDLPEHEKEEWDALEWGEEEAPDRVDAQAINQWLFNADTVDKVLELLMTRGHRVAGGDRIGKTIIFAKNTRHAEFIADRFNASYPQLRGEFARVVLHKDRYAQSLIDSFGTPDKAPHIAISVDMMDTGIDVPEVVNLVFFKQVRSKTKFWQMIGRGTRLCNDLYGPGQHKKDFLIFDFCENFEYFGHSPTRTEGSTAASLSERIFKAKVELISQLDQRLPAGTVIDGDGTRSEVGLRWDVANELRGLVAGMRLENFLVRPHRQAVERYADPASWQRLTPAASEEISHELAGLPSTVRPTGDEEAKRFDLMILRLQLARLGAGGRFDRTKADVQAIAAALLEQTNIPAIRAEVELLDQVAAEEWWRDVTLPMLEGLRRRVRSLVRLVEKSKRAIVYTDFEDQINDVTEVRLTGLDVGTDFERFREKVRVHLRTHEDHVALQKLRRNRQLSPTDLAELERMLVDCGGSEQEIAQARRRANGLGLFLRSLVGLDRQAATEVFDDFTAGRNLDAGQLDFINTMIDHLTQNGVMEPSRLYESPFTEKAPAGPDSVFPSADVDKLVSILRTVTARAAEPEADVA